jgi:hypothetical protein
VRHDELRRVVKSLEFCIVVENKCCITDVMTDFFVVRLGVLKRGWVHSCGMRRAVTSFEFRVAMENIRCITDVVIKIFVVTYYMT